MLIKDEIYHPDPCPGPDCRGQFFWIKWHGIICTARLAQLGGDPIVRAMELERAAKIERFEGLGLA